MNKADEIYFASQWMDFLNNDPELKKRTGPKGATPLLNGRDLIALELEGLAKPSVVSLKDGKFAFEERKAKDPKMTIKMPLSAFLKLVHPDARAVWSLMADDARLEVSDDIAWPEICTIFELLVCLAELADKNPELVAA